MKIHHQSDCAQHNEPTYPNSKCDCSPIFEIEKLYIIGHIEATISTREHEGQTEEREDYFIAGGNHVIDNAVTILKDKMNPEHWASASEYWYLAGIQDAIALLKQFQ